MPFPDTFCVLTSLPSVFLVPWAEFALGPSTLVDLKKLLSPRLSINRSRALNFFIQHVKVEASKLLRYPETEQFLQRQTSSDNYIVFLLTLHAA